MLERWIVVLVAIHSAGVGLLLLLMPEWSAKFGGWGDLMDPTRVDGQLEEAVEKLNAFYRPADDAGPRQAALAGSAK